MEIAEVVRIGSPEYPHLIVKGARRHQRWTISFGVSDSDPHTFPPELVDGQRRLAPGGREAILRHYVRRAAAGTRHHCVVWGPADCAWIDGAGGTRKGREPPEGEPVSPRDMNTSPALVEDVRTITLPARCIRSHLSVKILAPGYVEVAPAEPMRLAYLDEPLEDGEEDHRTGLLDGDGKLVPPETWRGQPVTGVENGWTLLGPIQPCGPGIVLREPWPDELAAACDAIAGKRLPASLHAAAWQAYRPERRSGT